MENNCRKELEGELGMREVRLKCLEMALACSYAIGEDELISFARLLEDYVVTGVVPEWVEGVSEKREDGGKHGGDGGEDGCNGGDYGEMPRKSFLRKLFGF